MTAGQNPFRLLACSGEERRALLIADDALQGIDFLEVVSPDQRQLEVHFLPKSTPAGRTARQAMLNDLDGRPERLSINGGVRVLGIRALEARLLGDVLRIRVNEAGDFSTYTLVADHPAMDPAFREVDFDFKSGCPARFDCGPRDDCQPERPPEPVIDYMAKDYASFRQVLLDYLATTRPDWRERHEADAVIALLELFAYTGDLISYEQDAVATEAYLGTARRRTSVRRHARLVDYRIDDGASAFTWAHLRVVAGAPPVQVPAGTILLPRLTVPVDAVTPPHPAVIRPGTLELERAYRAVAPIAFETLEAAELSTELNDIAIHTWGEETCTLPAGATGADLVGDLDYDPATGRLDAWRLRPGSRLVLEETAGVVLDPGVGGVSRFSAARQLADPTHRQVVSLTEVTHLADPLTGQQLTRVVWHPRDALRFQLCVAIPDAGLGRSRATAVARGNLVLADHGATMTEFYPENPAWPDGGPPPDLRGIDVGTRAYRFDLGSGPLSWRRASPAPPPPGATTTVEASSDVLRRALVPQVSLRIGRTSTASTAWAATADLLTETAFRRVFQVESESGDRTTLRFGDDVYGQAPPPDAFIAATYRVGVGPRGNLAAEALAHVLIPSGALGPTPSIELVRNPLPAIGGRAPESIEQVRQLAPEAFRAGRKRAVTAADYARVAEEVEGVQRSVATFRWTGSWLTVFLTIDPRGGGELDPGLRARVLAHVRRRTQTGYDLEVQRPIYAPLDLELQVCAARGSFRPDVEAAVLTVLASRSGEFFDPDRLTFGQPLYLSALYAAIEAVPGVDSVTALRFSRLRDADPLPRRPITTANVARGFIPVGPLEVLRLDNDASRPENGSLRLAMAGGE